jgi:hypothetical protein
VLLLELLEEMQLLSVFFGEFAGDLLEVCDFVLEDGFFELLFDGLLEFDFLFEQLGNV